MKLAEMYENVRSCVRVFKGLSDDFEVKLCAQPTALHDRA